MFLKPTSRLQQPLQTRKQEVFLHEGKTQLIVVADPDDDQDHLDLGTWRCQWVVGLVET